MSSTLRKRKGQSIDKVVQELDAFPKVPEPYVEQTASGAASKQIQGAMEAFPAMAVSVWTLTITCSLSLLHLPQLL